MKIAVIAHSYPSTGTPTAGTFIKVIARGFAAAGNEVVVVNPVPWPRSLKREVFPYRSVDAFDGGSIEELRPAYWTFTSKLQFPKLGLLNPARWTFRSFCSAAVHALNRMNFCPDVVYGHFLYFGGGGAIEVGRAFNVPSFIGVGEGEFWSVKPLGDGFAKRHLRMATRLIPNATHLADAIHERFGIPASILSALPNGIDPDEFYPRDRSACRKNYGIPQGAFVVGAVGNYNYKKGICRVGEAIRDLSGVTGIFAGSGDAPPVAPNIVFSKRVLHSQLPDFYSACDVFVLPTLIEGCCNALIEAMACGVPIISSNTKYTSDLLDDTCSIRVDPLDVNAIRTAIEKLRDDEGLRLRLSRGAIERAKKFHIKDRISKMLTLFRENLTAK